MPRSRSLLVTFLATLLGIACTQRSPRTANGQASDSLQTDLAGQFQAIPRQDTIYQVIMQRVASSASSDTAAVVRLTLGVASMGGDTMLLTRRWAPAAAGATASAAGGDSLILTRGDLMPVRERLETKGTVRTFSYDGPHVTGMITPADSAPRHFDRTFTDAPFAFNEVDLLVRSAPFTDGYRVIVPLFSEMDEAIEHDTITVHGTVRRDGRSGRRVRFADPAIVAEYVIDEASREILSHELTQRATGIRLRYIAPSAGTDEPRT